MNKIVVFTIGFLWFMSPTLLGVELYDEAPVDDAYVDSGLPGGNFGLETLQIQGFGPETPVPPDFDPVSIQQSYLKFDVSILQEKTLLSAVFGVHLMDFSHYATPSLQLHYVDDDNWSELGLTWNNRPLNTTLLGTIEQTDETGRYYEWDVFDDILNNDRVTDGFASYMLSIGNEDLDNYAHFPSREASGFQPYLRIEYIPEPATLTLLGLGTALIRIRKRQ